MRFATAPTSAVTAATRPLKRKKDGKKLMTLSFK